MGISTDSYHHMITGYCNILTTLYSHVRYWKTELASAVKQSIDMFNNFFFHLNFVKIGGPNNVESHVFIGFHWLVTVEVSLVLLSYATCQ